ncbi:protein of unknown function [Taphrina deformans PYCC 5710]|uniref:Uncharacterized protein n=1 Tax=Taphrina deformans (strain PYCC 5710 / ATCC 11124 / CBS 356.35 / IMI 108563 / JCM 9778 / NBRC 8474) TaxID=1097556 RepID=R4XEK5_TAPDE|nr:protein of unknown function [Taphrina deformans PYCC 5710]|eukprot:CCG84201.1 protein of unknown function [Taphrina deformans PYCC 5710]
MLFTKATFIAALVAIVSASPLEIRNTDPSGKYPVCVASSQIIGKPFYLAVTPYGSDAAYGAGFVQQVQDGQMFAGSNSGVDPPSQNCESATKPFFFFSLGGYLYDNHGRKVEIANGQLQANYGGGSTAFGLCTADHKLTVNNVNTIYACQNGPIAGVSYRLYTGSQAPADNNANCNVVYLTATYL